jgi:enoyl-CoA hydratase
MIEREIHEHILTLRLAHGKASALDLELCEALQSEFDEATAKAEVHAIVLTGSGSIFSAGVDLPRLTRGGAAYSAPFLAALDALIRTEFLFPKPLIAAVNGHAIAGGAILAFAADARLMSTGHIGVPEMLVGVPFPPIALEVVRFAIPPHHLQSMVYQGRTVDPETAHAIGIIDRVVVPEGLPAAAHAMAAHYAAIPPDVFRMTKRQIREPYLRNADSIAGDDRRVIWTAPETHERIREYVARTFGKKG